MTAAFWNRHFLHALPGVLLMAAPGMAALERRKRSLLVTLFWGTVLINLLWTTWFLVHGHGPGPGNLLD